MDKFRDILADASEKINIQLSEGEKALFNKYYKELIFWNKSVSLVSVKSPLDIPVKHFIDSLTVLNFIQKKASRLLDLGSGAGFPGVPLKIVLKPLRLTLVESSRKKASFLKNLTRKLDLYSVTIVNERIESIMGKNDHRGSYDIVISRATFKLPELIEIGEPFLSPGGTLIAMKGKKTDIEVRESSGLALKKGLALPECHDIELPITGHKRKILLFKKLPRI
ncbi:MAG: 16S rRNA (guanine(527)-N(7))-methyltransferase RsmG [Thermodesulfobacteriota bacterium]|nr:16S rRNA (guanine(527)-N(7))-methyltransferase RsmG [Thermodesulfobacteriota bacterium]